MKQQRLLCWILGGADLVAAGGMRPRHYDANGGGGGDRRDIVLVLVTKIAYIAFPPFLLPLA